ncbi:transcriptional regulator [Geomicrobium sp. JCM 19038]|uniref:helix-turn-helix transcriptional regulator n=1 Tax=Geomicrobium sp. JCM 19038 TaxID=1460635 RepID=UPI00045F1DD6|nr:PAS domain-containing protein [Geomicrobium sp. JCM 19038]GAK09200.1 YheO-like PAS domain protein [Geomicrobium sp. JCM 19038]
MVTIRPELASYVPIANMIAENFGDQGEVVIHDFADVSASLVYIKGNVTNRKVGAPMTDRMFQDWRKYGNEIEDNYGFTTRTKDGLWLKASLSYIRNSKGHVIGCLGINLDITALISTSKFLNTLVSSSDDQAPVEQEFYGKDIQEMFHALLEEAKQTIGIPITSMKRDDKIAFVKHLDRKGAFLIQGSAEQIADYLGVTKQTIYNYLDEIRK